jgi:gentisate 1,2-dioxygenase
VLDSIAERWNDEHVRPLWENQRAHGGGVVRPNPMLWRWERMLPLIEHAATLRSMEAIERRVLSLVDEAYADNGSATIRNLNAGLQILLPGESARPHRHSMNAIRFVLAGSDATTTVDGKPCLMREGDLVLTPGWTWHEHAHHGAERIVWLDVLDAQLHRFLGTDAFEPGPPHDVPTLPADDAFTAATMLPESVDQPEHSPVYRYPWAQAAAAVALAPPGADGLRRARYVNPATGGAAIALLDCALWQLDAGTRTRAVTTSAHAVCAVVEGRGTTTIGDTSLAWGPNDIFTLPSNDPVVHEASAAGPARIFVVSDREILRRLGLLAFAVAP